MDKPITDHPYMNGFGEREMHTRKGMIVFVSLMFIICVFAGCIHFLVDSRVIAVLQLAGFIALGLIYAAFIEKKSLVLSKRESFTYSMSLGAAIILALCVFYYFSGRFQVMRILSLSCAFILPYIVLEAWWAFNHILSVQHVWYYSKDLPAQPPFVYLENKQLQFKIMNVEGAQRVIPASAACSLNLGTVFYFVIKEEYSSGSTAPLFMNDDEQPYGWIFYQEKFGIWRKYLRPEDTILENKIRSNTVIIAERMDNAFSALTN